MLVLTTRLSCTRTAVSAAPVIGSLPPRVEMIRRAQYSPSGSPAGGVANRRTVCRSSGAIVRRRGKAWTHPAADGNVESGWSTVRRTKWPSESVTGYPNAVEIVISAGSGFGL